MNSHGGWYRIKNGQYEGACDSNKKEIITPNKYTAIYREEDYYYVKKGDYAGICDLNGKEIIVPDKYTSIAKSGKYYYVGKDNYQGLCDLNGKEIVPPKYYDVIVSDSKIYVKVSKDSEYEDLCAYQSGNSTASTSSQTDETPSVSTPSYSQSSSATSVSQQAKPKKATMYTISGVGRLRSCGQYTQNTGDVNVTVEFYDDYIMVDKIRYNLVQVSGGIAYFKGNNGVVFLVDGNYNMGMQVTINTGFGVETADYAMKKGLAIIAGSAIPGNSGSNYNYNNNNTQSQGRVCPRCHGSGRIEYMMSMPMYGTQDYPVKCQECGKTFMKSVGHAHKNCPLCHGKGYLSY